MGSILRNVTAGDLGSMAAALGVVVHFLATHPDLQAALRADGRELAAAIDEMLRSDEPFLVHPSGAQRTRVSALRSRSTAAWPRPRCRSPGSRSTQAPAST